MYRLVAAASMSLLAACASGTGGTPDSAPGECAEATTRCDGLTIQTCTSGAWVDGNACAFACEGGACSGVCEPGTTVACYTGPVGTEDVGACIGGQSTCSEEGTGGPCLGQVLPAVEEDCATAADDDCDGEVNEDCCTPEADLLLDPSFEMIGAGAAGAPWTETHTQYSPLCDTASCGVGGGTGPRGGTYWLWFGGTTGAETGVVSQAVVLPAGGEATLSFYLEIPACGAPATDHFRVEVDGTQLFEARADDAACEVVGYVQHLLDLSAYADGASHTITFRSATNSVSDVTNFFVDDVDLDVTCP
ncbi:MAG: hypothetical protein R2939_04795 [Kofleriaceae bacterium]